MASKFFTWTKGDRRNASEALQAGGIVPIPVECISFKGMDYGRSSKGVAKAGRRPLPLVFDRSYVDNRDYESRTHNSVALHDAAVQSATNLMVVMNDMLKSPPLSARVFSHHHSGGPAPIYGRPRSHTAPTTPLVEAPVTEAVELPGSLALENTSHGSLPHTVDSKVDVSIIQTSPNLTVGNAIVRPHSSPQETTFTSPQHRFYSPESFAQTANSLLPGLITPRSKTCSPNIGRGTENVPACSPDDTRSKELERNASATDGSRPCLSVLPVQAPNYTSLPTSRSQSHDDTWHLSPQQQASAIDSHTHFSFNTVQSSWIDEISRLRTAHQAHTDSLKGAHETYIHNLNTAHEKEMVAYKSYVSLLEHQHGISATKTDASVQTLSSNNSLAPTGVGAASTADASPSSSRSSQSIISGRKRVSQESLAEVESLKRKLSLSRKAQADVADIRRERDQLRDAAERSDRRISQLKEIVRKAKDNDQALKSEVVKLRSRLEAANNERVDVLEGYHGACEKVRDLSERNQTLSRELDDVRTHLYYSRPPSNMAATEYPKSPRGGHNRTMSDSTAFASRAKQIPQQSRNLQDVVATPNARINELHEASIHHDCSLLANHNEEMSAEVARLEQELEQHKQMLAATENDRDRYNALLHSEVRRQTRQSNNKRRLNESPAVDASDQSIFTEVALQRSAEAAGLSPVEFPSGRDYDRSQSPISIAELERDLKHCVNEIILYKLDVKGYKKDLRKAQAKIESLQAPSCQQPPTPESESISNGQKEALMNDRKEYDDSTPSGLGINVSPLPQTPTRSIAAATAAALDASMPSPTSPAVSPSEPRSRTPLATHKKLPRPPCALWPEQDVKRTETLRSLSESIISLYTKRSPPEPRPAMPLETRSFSVGAAATPKTSTVAS